MANTTAAATTAATTTAAAAATTTTAAAAATTAATTTTTTTTTTNNNNNNNTSDLYAQNNKLPNTTRHKTNYTQPFCILNVTRYRVTRLTETPVRTATSSVADFRETHV
jgi:hypothetical protein